MKRNRLNNSDNGISGPSHLEMYTEPILNPNKLDSFEWRRRIVSTLGNAKFNIDYYKVAYPSVEITDGQYEVISRAQPVEAIVKLSTKVSTSFIKNRKIYFKDKELPFYTALSL